MEVALVQDRCKGLITRGLYRSRCRRISEAIDRFAVGNIGLGLVGCEPCITVDHGVVGSCCTQQLSVVCLLLVVGSSNVPGTPLELPLGLFCHS